VSKGLFYEVVLEEAVDIILAKEDLFFELNKGEFMLLHELVEG